MNVALDDLKCEEFPHICYVNNVKDNQLKPITRRKFEALVSSERVKQLIASFRQGNKEAKQQLPALTFQGVLDKEKLEKDNLLLCSKGMLSIHKTRNSKWMKPSGLVMLDLDRVESPKALYTSFLQKLEERNLPQERHLALAHITPSGKGLRLVLRRTPGMSIAQEQNIWSNLVGIQCDPACKDIPRLSFVPQQEDILYYNPQLLFGKHEDFVEDLYATEMPHADETYHQAPPTETSHAITSQDPLFNPENETYLGVPLAMIVRQTEQNLGGAPCDGERHNFLLKMAARLRWLMNFDADVMKRYIPTYGLPLCEYVKIINDMSTNNLNFENMPHSVAQVVAECRLEQEHSANQSEAVTTTENMKKNPEAANLLAIYDSPDMPCMPERLPGILELVSKTMHNRTKGYASLAVFAALGTYLENVRFCRPNDPASEACFMIVAVGQSSTGKGEVDNIIRLILQPLYSEADEVEKRMDQWKDECSRSPHKKKPAKPKLGKQILNEDCTCAAKLEQQKLAAPRRQFAYAKELESLYKLSEGNGIQFYRDVCREYDNDRIGADRSSSDAVSGSVIFRLNWIAHCTPNRFCKDIIRYNAITNGALSRMNITLLPQMQMSDWNINRGPIGQPSDEDVEKLSTYTNTLRQIKNTTLYCTEAMDWYRREFNRHLAYATQNQHEAYMNIATRAIEVGYYRAMMLWLLDDRVWSKEIEDFVSWSIEYDLWSKLRLFGDQINIQFQQEMAAYNGDRNSSRSDELKSLPDVFTYEQVVNVRIMLGKPVDNHRMIQNQINQWVSRKKVIRNINTGKYEKTSRTNTTP